MGNALRSLLRGSCQWPTTNAEPQVSTEETSDDESQVSTEETTDDESQVLGHHGDTSGNVGVSALERDLLHFHRTSQVPTGLSQHVSSTKMVQATWYNELLKAWNKACPTPKSPEAAAKLVIQTLNKLQKANLEGLLVFYGLPAPQSTEETTDVPPPWPEGVKFELQTLPVHSKDIVDGDGFTVYVNAEEPREWALVPLGVQIAIILRAIARAAKKEAQAKNFEDNVVAAGYRYLKVINHEEILARKYRIRLRGIDAPEFGMPYWKKAKKVLVKMIQGHCLKIHVYGKDHFRRNVGDVYCNGIFVQELMLKSGCAWHYVAYDQRQEFSTWEKEARSAARGLWALQNPEKPWECRRNRRNCDH